MNKPALLRAVITELQNELRRQQEANRQASAGATHAETRAETQWDTCGLEASYLARGHAMQFKALVKALEELKTFMIPVYDGNPAGLGALLEVEQDRERMLCFLLPCAGGIELDFAVRTVTVITPESPLGAALMDKKKGDKFSFRAGSSGKVLSVS